MTLFAVGRILKSAGLKGWVKVAPITHSLRRFDKLGKVYVGMDDRSAQLMTIDDVTYSREIIMLKLNGIDERTASDKLIHHYVFVDEAHLVQPPHGSHFIHDIIGCRVFAKDQEIGAVVEVYTRSQGLSQDVWVVERSDGNPPKQLWIPVLKEFIEEVDIVHRRITVRRVEELSEGFFSETS